MNNVEEDDYNMLETLEEKLEYKDSDLNQQENKELVENNENEDGEEHEAIEEDEII